jgi:single-strand DNA-binding protein
MVNKVIMVGRIGTNPIVNSTGKGTDVSNFRFAVEDTWKTEGVLKKNTEWFNCVAWGKLSKTVNSYLDVGDTIYIEGRLQNRKWKDKGGVERITTEIHIKFLKMLITKGKVVADTLPAAPAAEDVPF